MTEAGAQIREPAITSTETDLRDQAEPWLAVVRSVVDARRVIVVGGAATKATVRWLRALGATSVFVLPGDAHALGADAGATLVRAPGDDVERQLARQAALHALSPEVQEAIDTFDPDGNAVVLGDNFYDASTLGGRTYLRPNRPEWTAWEDKVRAIELFAAAAVRVPAMRVVDADVAALRSADGALDDGLGTVWSADTRSFPSSGGTDVRWVRDEQDADAAAAWFAARAERVRVMPFIPGVPCSIHAAVTPDGIAVLRPVEQLVLVTEGGRFLWAGASTWWEPPPDAFDDIRAQARRVAAALHERCGYLGLLSLDGILGEEGFVATEVNPRWGAALAAIAAPLARVLPLRLLHTAMGETPTAAWDPEAFEALVMRVTGVHRRAVCWRTLDHDPGPRQATLDVDGEETVAAAGDGSITCRSAGRAFGGEVWLDVTTAGPEPLGPSAAAALAWAETTWGLGMGPLTAAASIRR